MVLGLGKCDRLIGEPDISNLGRVDHDSAKERGPLAVQMDPSPDMEKSGLRSTNNLVAAALRSTTYLPSSPATVTCSGTLHRRT